jgi:hypothetical protein
MDIFIGFSIALKIPRIHHPAYQSSFGLGEISIGNLLGYFFEQIR